MRDDMRGKKIYPKNSSAEFSASRAERAICFDKLNIKFFCISQLFRFGQQPESDGGNRSHRGSQFGGDRRGLTPGGMLVVVSQPDCQALPGKQLRKSSEVFWCDYRVGGFILVWRVNPEITK